VDALIEDAGKTAGSSDLVVDAAIRHLRTTSYLVRYTLLSHDMTDEQVWAGITEAIPRNCPARTDGVYSQCV
jgi:hypothetical protein